MSLIFFFFHSGGDLSLVRYGIQIAGAAPSNLLVPDLARSDLEQNTAYYPVCSNQVAGAACTPQLSQAVYLDNAPDGLTNSSAQLASVLTQLWRNRNPSLADLQVDNVTLDTTDRYSLLSANGCVRGPG